jgi:hypothetical protein
VDEMEMDELPADAMQVTRRRMISPTHSSPSLLSQAHPKGMMTWELCRVKLVMVVVLVLG